MKIIWGLLIAFMSISVSADPTTPSLHSFEKLEALLGDWKKEGADGDKFYISFQSTANGSVITENWIYKGASHSLTVYHRDGKNLLATHYCPQGNQPRLRLQNSDKDKGSDLSFVFQDATNPASQEASHQHSLAFEFVDEDTVIRSESYSKGGVITPSSLKLIRK
ncbi:hypothetical protein [Microbulbifer yueqingensis]|uniref:THAP4-like heme-binding beta-barrel domain-containing protein n=1 Tax=Microbulbifer yueqingensis TaxID=658219 RepID=A0A1G9D2P3_9GAMM|nr:hypothetical protein [Microbulbifer yueqingensis]SDK58202.1 hypothetical protein SAMN05216212_2719 [Microbulbifer yueqingensis]